jgi:hypothetical protein
MAWFDYGKIEDELGIEVPSVFREFLETAEANDYPISDLGFYPDSESLIQGNDQMLLTWDEWEDTFLAFGVEDGCGNCYFISAESVDDDELYLMAHDPPGIEPEGSAREFFALALKACASGKAHGYPDGWESGC